MNRQEFITTIAPIIVKYAKQKGYKYPSAIIAQACNESGFKINSWFNLFGMKCGSKWKGNSVNTKTKEFENGKYVTVSANWRAYATLEDGIKGYFDFINTTRYKNLKDATSTEDYLIKIKSDGYATSPTYVNNVMAIVNQYNLTIYDDMPESNTDSKTYIVNTNKDPLRLRVYPNGAIILLMPKGSKVELIEWGVEWSKVKYKNTIGYCSSKFLKRG